MSNFCRNRKPSTSEQLLLFVNEVRKLEQSGSAALSSDLVPETGAHDLYLMGYYVGWICPTPYRKTPYEAFLDHDGTTMAKDVSTLEEGEEWVASALFEKFFGRGSYRKRLLPETILDTRRLKWESLGK